MRFISHHEVKWGLVGDGVGVVIVSKFCVRDFVGLGTQVISTEDPNVCFNLLIDMFYFSVGLGVIGSREQEIVVKKFAEFFGESRGKL